MRAGWCWGFLRPSDLVPLPAKRAAEFQKGISMYQGALKTIAEGSQPHSHASMASLLENKRAEVDYHPLSTPACAVICSL